MQLGCGSARAAPHFQEVYMSDSEKALDVTSSADFAAKIPDVQVVGDPDTWKLICKASSKSQGWMKSTKAMLVPGIGVLVQVSTQQFNEVAEAITLVPGAYLKNIGGKLSVTATLATGATAGTIVDA